MNDDETNTANPHVKRVKVYAHRSKESNWDLADKLGFEDRSEAHRTFCFLGYEVALIYDVDTRTGEAKLVGADGFFLGDEQVSDNECEVAE